MKFSSIVVLNPLFKHFLYTNKCILMCRQNNRYDKILI